jgi:histidinol-phosphate aminotransferase
LAATQFILSHNAVLETQAKQIMAERTLLFDALTDMADGINIQPYPSAANFILVKVPDANQWFATLKSQGILVKNVSNLSPLLHNCLRLTVGNSAENKALIAALRVLAYNAVV